MEKRKEAEAAIELMKATYSRIRDEEESKRGLLIIKAEYGKLGILCLILRLCDVSREVRNTFL